ncbi:MAG: hypothetical protein HUK14_10285 [Muribaculaceae bacterium]|nr:hypothetical protein [Muribaculaceae bacterium]
MKFKVTVATGESGITAITSDTDTDAVYYRISGICVPACYLATGLYIRRQCTQAEKILIK